VDEGRRLPKALPAGTPLFGKEELSIPPCEGLAVHGSDLVRRWLDGGGSREVTETYDREYQQRCPLYRDDVYVVLGGWHGFWADMDAYDEEKGRLVLWTFQDAEPWVEVWLDEGGRLKTVRRIT
jgi:hypothetical protein